MTFFVVLLGLIDTSRGSAGKDLVIKQRIENEASTNSGLKATGVKIAVENGYVVLYGTVKRYIQKMDYERIAWKTSGVKEVDNEIIVSPLKPLTDGAIERKIMEIVQTYRQFHGVRISVSVNAGAVGVTISLNQPADILFFKRKIAEIDGVVSIDIRANLIAMTPIAPLPGGAAPRPDRVGYSNERPT
jgi:hypothetical protein